MAADVAKSILTSNGINNVTVERVPGNLTDHYDPRHKVLRLSDSVFSSNSASAIGVAAHEAGHAVQHAVGYLPIKIRACRIGTARSVTCFRDCFLQLRSYHAQPHTPEHILPPDTPSVH